MVAKPILIIDDDEDIRAMVATILESMGYAVETSGDGADAIRRLHEGLRPSLILLDMMMPRLDGEAFLEAERSDPAIAGVPVVLLSGHASAQQKAEELRADGYLVKPVELDDLLNAVEQFAHD